MGKDDIVEHIESQPDTTTLSGDDLDVSDERECRYCGCELPADVYDPHDPDASFVEWHFPGEDDVTPPGTDVFCRPSCFVAHYEDLQPGETR